MYPQKWWPEHDGANRKWIAAVEPLLARCGAAVRKDIAAAYQVEWPAAPIRTDVAAYAGVNGGEASHTIDDRVSAALDAELKARGRLFRRRGFSHAIQGGIRWSGMCRDTCSSVKAVVGDYVVAR